MVVEQRLLLLRFNILSDIVGTAHVFGFTECLSPTGVVLVIVDLVDDAFLGDTMPELILGLLPLRLPSSLLLLLLLSWFFFIIEHSFLFLYHFNKFLICSRTHPFEMVVDGINSITQSPSDHFVNLGKVNRLLLLLRLDGLNLQVRKLTSFAATFNIFKALIIIFQLPREEIVLVTAVFNFLKFVDPNLIALEIELLLWFGSRLIVRQGAE